MYPPVYIHSDKDIDGDILVEWDTLGFHWLFPKSAVLRVPVNIKLEERGWCHRAASAHEYGGPYPRMYTRAYLALRVSRVEVHLYTGSAQDAHRRSRMACASSVRRHGPGND